MTNGLFLAIAISLFAVGGAVILLWRYRDWRFGFLAGLSLFASAWVLTAQVSQLLGEGTGWSGSRGDRALASLCIEYHRDCKAA